MSRQDGMPAHMYNASSIEPRRAAPPAASPTQAVVVPSGVARARAAAAAAPQYQQHATPLYALPEPRRISVPPPSSVILERPAGRRPAYQSSANYDAPTSYASSPEPHLRRSRSGGSNQTTSPDQNPFRIFSGQATGPSGYGGDPRSSNLPAPARLPPPSSLGAPPRPQQNTGMPGPPSQYL